MSFGNLSELIDFGVEHSKRIIEGEDREIVNCYIAEAGKEVIYIIAPWNGYQERDIVLARVRGLFRIKKVDRYIQCSEGWRGHDSDVPPSEDPDRQECLFVIGVDKSTGERAFRQFTITELPDGSRRLDEDSMDNTEFGGTAFEMLDIDPALH